MLHEARHPLENAAIDAYWCLVGWPLRLLGDIDEAKNIAKNAQARKIADLKSDILDLKANLKCTRIEIAAFIELGDFARADDRCHAVIDMEDKLTKYGPSK